MGGRGSLLGTCLLGAMGLGSVDLSTGPVVPTPPDLVIVLSTAVRTTVAVRVDLRRIVAADVALRRVSIIPVDR
jgi:hypothetical protein